LRTRCLLLRQRPGSAQSGPDEKVPAGASPSAPCAPERPHHQKLHDLTIDGNQPCDRSRRCGDFRTQDYVYRAHAKIAKDAHELRHPFVTEAVERLFGLSGRRSSEDRRAISSVPIASRSCDCEGVCGKQEFKDAIDAAYYLLLKPNYLLDTSSRWV
jgi:hypothetical protein